MIDWLRRIFRKRPSGELPDNLADLRGADPCWCGSGRKYSRCHRPEDRRRMRELGINPEVYRANPFV